MLPDGTQRKMTAPELVEQLGFLADRISVNIELPSEAGLKTLAPDKTKQAILAPMRQIQVRGKQNHEEIVKYRHAPKFSSPSEKGRGNAIFYQGRRGRQRGA